MMTWHLNQKSEKKDQNVAVNETVDSHDPVDSIAVNRSLFELQRIRNVECAAVESVQGLQVLISRWQEAAWLFAAEAVRKDQHLQDHAQGKF